MTKRHACGLRQAAPARAARFAGALCLAAAGCAGPVMAQAADAFPVRPITMIIPDSPGGPGEAILRLIGPRVTASLGQPVVADFRPGAMGLIAAEALARSAPDGHTLFMPSLNTLLGTLLHQKDLLGDFTAVTMLGAVPFAITVPAEVPARTIAEFIAWAKDRQPEAAFASTGKWGPAHLCMETFSQMADISLQHVPYQDASLATSALISGQVQAYCAAAGSARTMARTGKVRMLGVTYRQPTRLLRGIDPVSETLPGFEFTGWYGIQGNKGTPRTVVDQVRNVISRTVRSADISERLMATGIDPLGSTPEEFARFLRNESARFAKILKDNNAKAE